MYTSLQAQFQDRAPGDFHTHVQLTSRGNKATSLIQCPLQRGQQGRESPAILTSNELYKREDVVGRVVGGRLAVPAARVSLGGAVHAASVRCGWSCGGSRGGGNGGGRPTVAVQMGGCGRAGPQAATRQAFYIMAISAWQYIRLFIHTEMYSLSAMRGVGTLSRERGRLCPLESGRQLWRQRAQSMSPSAACSGDPDRRACEERPKHGNCCNRNLEHFIHRQRVNNEPKRTGM